jgi:nitroimidazol reductase NimA-like FMN-containing flavoprotein (pyridoxamine 5'-phosphate oxidase superfamily)
MVVKLPKMSGEEVDRLLDRQMLCRIAFKGDQHPYIAPFQYVRIDGTLYFHFTDYGKKMKLIGRDQRVCVEIESYEPDLSAYCFVVLRGSIQVVTEPGEREMGIRRMSKEAESGLSTNFLVAHGFAVEEGWSTLSPDKPLVIMKLVDVTEVVGLKSPG